MLSIIIVNFNAEHLLQKCIESIYKQTITIPFDIWVVDNGSCDNSVEMLKNRYPQVNLIENKHNPGFAKANNQAISKCRCDYILLLNPDTQITDNNIESAIRVLEKNPRIGILGPKLIDSKGKVQDSCRPFMTPHVLAARCWRRLFRKSNGPILDNRNYDSRHYVDWICGASMLVSKKAIEKVGLMDERYFMYIEDMDWCKRFWDSGFKVVYWPAMVIRHDATRKSSMCIFDFVLNKYVRIHLVSYIKFLIKYPFNWSRNES